VSFVSIQNYEISNRLSDLWDSLDGGSVCRMVSLATRNSRHFCFMACMSYTHAQGGRKSSARYECKAYMHILPVQTKTLGFVRDQLMRQGMGDEAVDGNEYGILLLTPWLLSASELCRPSDRRFLAK
jgi:hypothetical protein